MAVKKEDVVDFISNMSVLELSELIKEFEEKFGVSAAAPVAVAGAGGAPVAGGEAAEEKTEFNLHLESFGDKKIDVIKVVRGITGLGLKEAKELVEGAPKVIKESLSKEDAEKHKAELEKAGAKAKLD